MGRRVERGIREGQIREDVRPPTAAAMCLALLRGVAMQWLVDPQCFDLAAVRESVNRAIRASLAP